MGDVTPPVLHGPTSKEKKYDRQLRLWAANGQAALEEAHVLLINSGPGVVGIEALKNLVLPGTGNFTILDPSLVTEADLGANFFLEDEDLGKFRAEGCVRWLQELNPDVRGHHIAEPVETFISKEDSLLPYTLIFVIMPIAPDVLDIISQHSDTFAVPVFYIHSIGFYSHFTIQLPSAFPIVDTHPDPATTTDLRLLEAWPELVEISGAMTRDLEQMEDDQHGHVPYVALLLHYLDQWKSSHEGLVPQSYKEKSEFRDTVRRGGRTENAEGGEENFEEAVGAVLKALNPHTSSSAVREVFEAPECTNLTKASSDFWVIARAISDFYAEHSVLPLSGALPDMKAKSADYMRLQSVYKSRARSDVEEVMERVREWDAKLARPSQVDVKEVEAFCKNAGYIKVVTGRSPHLVRPRSAIQVQWKDRARFAAYDSFAASHSAEATTVGTRRDTSPSKDDNPDTEAEKMTGIAHTLMNQLIKEAETSIEEPEYSELQENLADIVSELVRAGGGELHNIGALTGGMVAQEAIKVITKQYIPVDNTCIFDGIASRSSVLRL